MRNAFAAVKKKTAVFDRDAFGCFEWRISLGSGN